MKNSKFTESQIAFVLKQAETGVNVEEVCRKTGISEATFYNWKKKYGGMVDSGIKEITTIGREEHQIEADRSGFVTG